MYTRIPARAGMTVGAGITKGTRAYQWGIKR